MTLLQLKVAIAATEAVPVERQRIIFNAREMQVHIVFISTQTFNRMFDRMLDQMFDRISCAG